MMLLCLILNACIVVGFSLTYTSLASDEYALIYEWVVTHKPVEIESIEDLDPEILLKSGMIKIKDTKTLVVPDGDYINIMSFDASVVSGEKYYFAEYDFAAFEVQEQMVTKVLGTGLDNTRSDVDNSIEYSVSLSRDKTKSLIASVGVDLMILVGLEGEVDFTKGNSISETASCTCPASMVCSIESSAYVQRITNIKKRPIIIEATKDIKNCIKSVIKANPTKCFVHDLNYDLGEWEPTELEKIKGLSLTCKAA